MVRDSGDDGAGQQLRRSVLQGLAGTAAVAPHFGPPRAMAAPSASATVLRFAVVGSARHSPRAPGGGGPDAPFRTTDFDTVGVFDIDWLLEPRYTRLLDAMAASPGAFGGVRFFGALNSGEREDTFPTRSGGVWRAPDGPMDFSETLEGLAALTSRGFVPFVGLTFFPPAVSAHPIEPPEDFGRWQALVRGFLDAVSRRFGGEEIGRWRFEVFNEPNMPTFWRGSFDRYLDLYRATSEAVVASGHAVRLGGPALAYMPGDEGPGLMERFLDFLRREPSLKCDFVSLHRKGAWTNEEGEPRIERSVRAAADTAEAALRLVPDRCRGLAIVNNEADEKVGFHHPYEPRLDQRLPSWLAAQAIAYDALSARYAARGMRFLAAADNANQHLVREPFDGRRSLMTRTTAAPDDLLKLPVFGFYEMLRLLGDRRASFVAPEDAFGLDFGLFHVVTAAEDRIGVLFTSYPDDAGSARPVELDYTLRDIPWPRVNLAEFRIDGARTNAYAEAGRRMPAVVETAEAARRIRAAAELGVAAPIRRDLRVEGGRLRLPLRLDPYATVLVWVTPVRRDAPAAPRWLEPVVERGNVVLRWTPNREPSFYSYEVVRVAPGGVRTPIAPVPLRSAMWVDTAAPRGEQAYSVRAVTASGVRSASVRSPPVRVV
jgi:glycosyl hydrolase family 39 (putative alpha-L-iduronidase)